MRNTRWVVPAAVVLTITAFVGWGLFDVLSGARSLPGGTPDYVGTGSSSVDAAPALYGVIKSLDRTRRIISLRVAMEDGNEHDRSYDLAEDVKMLADGHAAPNEVLVGTPASLKFGSDGQRVVAICPEPFRITVTPTQDEFVTGKPFNVIVHVTNVSQGPRSLFRGRSSAWGKRWKSSHPAVTMGSPPDYGYSMAPVIVPLGGGESSEWLSPMFVRANGRVSFRLGFSLLADHDYGLGERTYWTPEVTVNVTQGPKEP
jgi:hypothetical protein